MTEGNKMIFGPMPVNPEATISNLRATITTLQEQNKSLTKGLEEAVKALELCQGNYDDPPREVEKVIATLKPLISEVEL